jgi:uncharacterized protein (TIGR02246 family)
MGGVDRNRIERWVERYVGAWNSNDPNDIGSLFAKDGIYRTGPFDQPWRGRHEIVDCWLDRKDEPGNTEFDYRVLATDNDLGIVQGWTKYLQPPTEYGNLWLIKLDPEGRCTEFTEYWMKREQ